MSGVTDQLGGALSTGVGGLEKFDLGNSLGIENHYQTALTPEQQSQLAASIIAAQGNVGQVYGQQNDLAALLMKQATGGGPNPAQIMLNQATAKNAQAAAGQVAGVKGINPALAGRLASQNAATANQQAAGQGALMGAQQQLAGQSSLGNLYGLMGNQQNQNLTALGGVLNPTQQINAATAAGNQQSNTSLAGGLLSGGSAAAMAAGKAHGGYIDGYADGGSVEINKGQMYKEGFDKGFNYDPSTFLSNTLKLSDGGSVPSSHVGKFLAGLLDAPAMNSGGSVNMKSGGEVPGQASVPGDSLKNDTVPAMLSPDEIVIPRSIIMGPNPAKMAGIFVANEIAKKKKRSA